MKKQFRDEENYTDELAESLAAKFVEDYKTGRVGEEGWSVGTKQREPVYSESKMFLNVYLVALAKSLAKSRPEGHKIFVVGCCPGVVDTDMIVDAKKAGFVPPFPPQPPAVGADTGVWLALLPKDELAPKSGKFFAEREEYAFGWVINF